MARVPTYPLSPTAWLAVRPALVALYKHPNEQIRDRARGLVLGELCARWWVSEFLVSSAHPGTTYVSAHPAFRNLGIPPDSDPTTKIWRAVPGGGDGYGFESTPGKSDMNPAIRRMDPETGRPANRRDPAIWSDYVATLIVEAGLLIAEAELLLIP